MPEGHSIHRLARQFRDVFVGAVLAVSSPQERFAAGAARIDGQRLEAVTAHGKQLFLRFGNDTVLRVHLGLYGAWDFGGDATFSGASSIGAPRRIGERELAQDPAPAPYLGPPPPQGAVRVRLASRHGWADLRGPTACELLTPDEAATIRATLGPDPLQQQPGARADFVTRIRRSRSSVAVQLMRQEVLAGVGNIYRAELLFRQGVPPTLPGTALSPAQAGALWDDAVRLLADGVRDGAIITTALADRPSGLGVDVGRQLPGRPNELVPAQDAHYVYQRAGQPCRRCQVTIAGAELAGRKLFWCPGCQQGAPTAPAA